MNKTHKWRRYGFDYSTVCRPKAMAGWESMLAAHEWSLVDCEKCLKKRCERCNGTGTDPELDSYYDSSLDEHMPTQMPCNQCFGDGNL